MCKTAWLQLMRSHHIWGKGQPAHSLKVPTDLSALAHTSCHVAASQASRPPIPAEGQAVICLHVRAACTRRDASALPSHSSLRMRRSAAPLCVREPCMSEWVRECWFPQSERSATTAASRMMLSHEYLTGPKPAPCVLPSALCFQRGVSIVDHPMDNFVSSKLCSDRSAQARARMFCNGLPQVSKLVRKSIHTPQQRTLTTVNSGWNRIRYTSLFAIQSFGL